MPPTDPPAISYIRVGCGPNEAARAVNRQLGVVAGLGISSRAWARRWTPRTSGVTSGALRRKRGIEGVWATVELRHTFISVMSEPGMAVVEMARLAGHSGSRTTETIPPRAASVITTGADVMAKIFI